MTLICPITFDIFRDPVIANDGHVYERAAITQWIIRRGTSPIIRQPLRVEELQSADYLRRLAAQRRNSPTLYNIPLEEIPTSTIRPIPSVITETNPAQFNPVVVNNERNKSYKDLCIKYRDPIIAICAVVVIIVSTIIYTLPKNSKPSKYKP